MKPNYFTIHKNKKPKRLFKRSKLKPNPFIAQMVLVGALGATQISLTASQPIPAYKKSGFNKVSRVNLKATKELQILNTSLNTAKAIDDLCKKANRFEFERLGHYTRKYKVNNR